MRTVWKVSCFYAQYTFLIYRVESVLFLCIVHISDILWGKCSISVHSTHFRYTVWKVFCWCAQYMSDVPSGKCSVSVHNTYV
jgi:hypothetical protein